MKPVDVLIIGGGIIGLATALQLLRLTPRLKVIILEKEKVLAWHQTGHNSGVIHSGVYYKPGSLKAKNCRLGVQELIAFCNIHQISYEKCGKVIVATSVEEFPLLEELYQRGQANGVPDLEMIGPERLKEIEPAAEGKKALHCPHTAIVDYVQVANAYAREIKRLGGEIFLSEKVISICPSAMRVETEMNEYLARTIINCAGVYADRVANLSDPTICPKQIIPFRGEYYELVPKKRHLVQGLIYPVANPRFPFLGVHLSKTIDGLVEAGPNAVLALSREGYHKTDINFSDCLDYLTYRGFFAMAMQNWKIGLYEIYRSYSKRAFLKAIQRLVPEIRSEDLISAASGVRSQLVTSEGKLFDDFSIVCNGGIINVLNAPSPGATASLSIGKHIASLVR